MGVEMVASTTKAPSDQAAQLAVNFKHKLQQFCHLYFVRIHAIRPLLDIQKWEIPADDVLATISELSGTFWSDRDCVISGVIMKKFEKRPDVFHLGSLLVEKSLVPQREEGSAVYTGENDEIMLEDATSWVKVTGLPVGILATGMVVAVRGTLNAKNVFHATDHAFCRVEQPAPPISEEATGSIGFISGSLPTEQNDLFKLVNFLQKRNLSKLIVCGNAVGSDMNKFANVDSVFQVLSKRFALDVMTGEDDPSTGMLPYAPISKLFFPKASKEAKFTLRANPCAFTEAGVRLLGTSGENVTDLLRCSTLGCSIEALKTILHIRHLAPTAPDTLPCMPHKNEDVLVMDTVPHVLFAGNQDSFGVHCENGVSLISIPAFEKQPGVTLVATDNPGEVQFVPL
eukprot:GEMP01038510.1.p1 GENE.GEMP01038510.1~~GEMP01038510.1.p1  ORF type:complete len:399 (+),score=91.54 GEMP01038510.1:38-1234(+)